VSGGRGISRAISRLDGTGGIKNFMTEEEDLYVRASNSMIDYLPPDELERFAALEQEISSLKAEMQEMMQTARGRKLTDWREPTDAEELAILEQFPADERDAIAQMYPGELEQISELGIRLGEAMMKLAEIIRDSGSRTVT
jgi:hypothetical protein